MHPIPVSHSLGPLAVNALRTKERDLGLRGFPGSTGVHIHTQDTGHITSGPKATYSACSMAWELSIKFWLKSMSFSNRIDLLLVCMGLFLVGESKMTETHFLASRSPQEIEGSALGALRTQRVTLTLSRGSRGASQRRRHPEQFLKGGKELTT